MRAEPPEGTDPVCYRTLDEIATALSGKDAHGEGLRRVAAFLAPRIIFVEDSADHASSLIVLTTAKGGQSDTRFRAHLHLSPRIRELPLIKRTGTLTPWMPGHQLGFDDHVTDPDLQRTGCLALTDLTGLEEALVFFLRAVSHIRSDPTRVGQAVARAEEATGGPGRILGNSSGLQHAIKNAIAGWDAGPDSIFSALSQAISAFRGPGGYGVPEKAKPGLTAVLAECITRANPSVPDPIATAGDLLTAFLSNMQYAHRQGGHLASDRLNSAFTSRRIRNFVAQGAGDLSMNQWNVAFFHAGERGEDPPRVFLPENEPFTNRTYNCLVQWNRQVPHQASETLQRVSKALHEHQLGVCLADDLAIAKLKFLPGSPFVRLPNEANDPAIRALNKTLHQWIDFALYGKLVLRAGRMVRPAEVIDEFQDLRHVFLLPNLNRKISVADGKRELKEICSRDPTDVLKQEETRDFVESWCGKNARYLFEQLQYNDVWLLEHALLSDTNLRRLACNSVISVRLTQLGAPLPWIQFTLLLAGYNAVRHDYEVNEEGKFTWDWSDRSAPKLLIHLRKSCYPCTMIGIGRFGEQMEAADVPSANTMFLLAWGHDLQRGGHTIWDCAEVLRSLGAEYALVLDEGQDVFQTYIADMEAKQEFVQLHQDCDYDALKQFMPVPISSRRIGGVEVSNRRSMRASIAFWQERT